jgi:hypothetical protein
MADYYPLLARAISGLEQNTGEARRALYERARGALLQQLNSVQPPLPVSEVTRERLGLEEAIRRVEAEAAERARIEAQAVPVSPHIPDDFDPAVLPPDPEPIMPGAPEPAPPDPVWAVEPPPSPPKLSDRGLKGYRAIMGEAEELGDATAKAAESAREFYEAIPGSPARGRERAQPEPRHDRDYRHAQEPEDLLGDDGAHRPPRHPHDDEEEVHRRPARSYAGIIKAAVVILILLVVAGVGYWQRNAIATLYTSLRGQPAVPQREATTPQQRPKISDRIGSSGGQQDAKPGAAAEVAQKVVLYEEDPNDPQGKRYVGSVLWRTETVSPGPGLAPELAIRADLEIPERKMRMTWSLRRNTDKALPASHTIEIMFTVAPDFDGGGIANVPGVLMKQAEQTRGVPLAGLAVKVTDNYFLIGLSAVDADVQRNIQLLKERSWFDIPVVYNNNRRAIIAVEKGTPGERVFDDAFRAWGQ